LRATSFEYGILPYPKLTENLDYMSAAGTSNGNGVVIPVTAPPEKFDATCAVIESLCAEAYRNVVPTWYETALKIKYADAEIDAQMVDIIYDHIYAPLIMMADKEIGIGSIFTNAVFGSKDSGAFTSYYEKNEGKMQKAWDKMINAYLELE
jgi:disulfide oxidoreductase YuzD